MLRLLGQDLAHAERCVRDIIALSTLPSLWLGADTSRMAESLAAALHGTLGGPAVVYVALREREGDEPVSVAQVDRYRTDAAVAAAIGPRILEWASQHDPDEVLAVAHPLGGGDLRFAVQGVGFSARLGVIAAGSPAAGPPSAMQQTMLNICATHAAAAVQNAKLVRSLRESIAERERAEEALRQADRRKDEFIATLSHELRNPLAAITTATQLMRLRGVPGDELAMVERQAAHLNRLVDDLLDVSRIANGKIELRRRRVEIASVLAHALEMAAPLLRPRRQAVDLSAVPMGGLAVDADPERLAQVVFNLVSNASKYSEPGASIILRAWSEGGRVRLSVRDRGMGIAPDMIAHVFDQFVQQPQTLARSEGGLGLGLTVVRGLVELHGGTVHVRSEVGRGSEFIVDLPAAGPATEVASESRAGLAYAAAGPRAKRILVVDDNVDAGTALAELLGVLGHDVRVAHDGPAALDMAREQRPELALIDIGLPGMDGYELARRLRAQFAGGSVPHLVAVSGYGLDGDRERSAHAGFAEHLVKPVDLSSLSRLVNGPSPRASPGLSAPWAA